MLTILFVVSVVAAVTAHGFGNHRLVYVFKPLSTALLVPLALGAAHDAGSTYVVWIIAGLLLSLAGDVFLMLPADRFREGLASFFLAHVAYLAAFSTDSGWFAHGAPYLLYALAGAALLPRLWPGVPPVLRIAVLLYVVVLLLMAAQAGSRALELQTLPAAAAALGGLLFVVSDTVLAWNRFRAPVWAAPVLVHASYFPAQWLIAVSVAR